MATAETWLDEFRNHAPGLLAVFENVTVYGNELADPEVIRKIYQSVESDSIDYALLEKSKPVAVLPVDMEWSDLGSWENI